MPHKEFGFWGHLIVLENPFRGLQALRSVFLYKTKGKTQWLFELQPLFFSSHHQRAYKTLWQEADFPVACLAACPWLTLIQLELTSTTQWHLKILHPGHCFSSLVWLLLYFSHGGKVQDPYWKTTDFHAKKTPSFVQFSAHPQGDEGFLHLLITYIPHYGDS